MQTHFLYQDRHQAGKILAKILLEHGPVNPMILALPRGGVIVAKEVAHALRVPFDVLIVRKIGAPFHPEYGIGAISEDMEPLLNAGSLLPIEDLDYEVEQIINRERIELKRRMAFYRESRPLPDVHDKNVILVDDGLATGVTAAAAGKFLKSKGARRVLLAVPVGPKEESELVKTYIDEIICPLRPAGFTGIGPWYKDFRQVTDAEVMSALGGHHPATAKDMML